MGEKMCYLSARLQHKYFSLHRDISIHSMLDHSEISIYSNNDVIEVKILGQTDDDVNNSFFETCSLFFIYFGSFPSIIDVDIDGSPLNLSELIGKYTSAECFIRATAICNIEDKCFSNDVYKKLHIIPPFPLYSLQYLISESYKEVLIPHKLTLMLHSIEGINKPNDKMSFFDCVNTLCEETFFEFDKKFQSGILNLLGKDEHGFVQSCSDTRNWYSHFLPDDKKTERLSDGKDMWFYFEILNLSIRLKLCSLLGNELNENSIKETLFCIHDWIVDAKELDGYTYKSNTYIFQNEFEKLKKLMEEHKMQC